MPAPKGNNYWQFRKKHGRDFKYDSELLWNEFIDYSNWLEENPLYEMKVFCFKGEVTKVNVPKMRAMTLGGFQSFADISHTTWDNYKEKDDFIAVTHAIEKAIRNQKFEGAAAELLNPNIIARDLGLTDKKDHTSSDGTMTPQTNIVTTLSDEELKQRLGK